MTRQTLKKLHIFFIFFYAISFAVFLLFNGGAYFAQIRYKLVLSSPLASAELKEGEILEVQDIAESLPAGKFQLIIQKISVEAPIANPRDASKQGVLASLEEGVGLYPGSAPIGSPDQRSIVLGHSSLASWYRGGYATVFALLPELEPLDEFYVVGDGKKYTYRVFSKQFLTPQDTNIILAGPSSGSELDLITCYPIGSASKRTLIRASLVNVQEL